MPWRSPDSIALLHINSSPSFNNVQFATKHVHPEGHDLMGHICVETLSAWPAFWIYCLDCFLFSWFCPKDPEQPFVEPHETPSFLLVYGDQNRLVVPCHTSSPDVNVTLSAVRPHKENDISPPAYTYCTVQYIAIHYMCSKDLAGHKHSHPSLSNTSILQSAFDPDAYFQVCMTHSCSPHIIRRRSDQQLQAPCEWRMQLITRLMLYNPLLVGPIHHHHVPAAASCCFLNVYILMSIAESIYWCQYFNCVSNGRQRRPCLMVQGARGARQWRYITSCKRCYLTCRDEIWSSLRAVARVSEATGSHSVCFLLKQEGAPGVFLLRIDSQSKFNLASLTNIRKCRTKHRKQQVTCPEDLTSDTGDVRGGELLRWYSQWFSSLS